MSRYSPAFVTLHWLSACLIVMLLSVGHIVPQRLHVIVGMLIGGMFVIRFLLKLRLAKSRPVKPKTGVPESLAVVAHNIIYGLVFAVVFTGIGIAINSYSQTGTGMDANMLVQSLHYWLTNVLKWAISIHVLAALFHQFVLKDQLFSRIWFNREMKVSHINLEHVE